MTGSELTAVTPTGSGPLVEVEDLHVRFGRGPEVVSGISFTIGRGECVALVGESGSGKSVTARSLVGLTGQGSRLAAGALRFDGMDLTRLPERSWRTVRGARIGFVLQDALSSLDPLRPVGREIAEPLRLHRSLSRTELEAQVTELLGSVGVPEPDVRARQYPHELSGGLRQRALIASAIACGPELLIADEPTTALDTTVQAQILDLLRILRSANTGMLLVSHDLSVVAQLADRVVVLRGGHLVEQGPTARVLAEPAEEYTRALIAAVPGGHTRGTRLSRTGTGVAARFPSPVTDRPAAGPPVIEATDLLKRYAGPDGVDRTVVDGVGFTVHRGRTLGIVGESGSGKTTTARLVLGLETPDSGTVRVHGQEWATTGRRERQALRRRVQLVHQDPLAAFDPRFTVGRALSEAASVAGPRTRSDRADRVVELLGLVGLEPELTGRRPNELSGGQRQRVAIARALAAEPDVLVCDEPVSALDVSVQAQVLDLLDDLQRRLGVAYLFISHDLGVVAHVSDEVLVMKDGEVVERGDAATVLTTPTHPYTEALLSAVPRLPVPTSAGGSR